MATNGRSASRGTTSSTTLRFDPERWSDFAITPMSRLIVGMLRSSNPRRSVVLAALLVVVYLAVAYVLWFWSPSRWRRVTPPRRSHSFDLATLQHLDALSAPHP